MKIDLLQIKAAQENMGVSAHTLHHYPSIKNDHLGAFLTQAPECGITVTLGNKLNLQLVNQMAAFAMWSPSRVHFHIGSVAMHRWRQNKDDRYFKIRNTFRSPHVILNKVNSIFK